MEEAVHFGRYLLDRRLAVGPETELMLARVMSAAGFRKSVIIVRLLEELPDPQASLRRFAVAAKLSAQLAHDNLMVLYEYGTVDDLGFMAFEYLEGVELERIIERSAAVGQATPLPLALHIVAEAAAGLAAVHEAVGEKGEPLGLVHGNITPACVILTARGGIKIADFISPRTDLAEGPSRQLRGGRPGYLSPEQLNGAPASVAGDLFSLGAVLHELLTAQPCFKGASAAATAALIRDGRRARAGSLCPELPASVESLLDSMLEVDPRRRLARAAAVAVALRSHLAAVGTPSAEEVAAHVAAVMEVTVRSAWQLHAPFAERTLPVSDEDSDPATVADPGLYERLNALVASVAEGEVSWRSVPGPREPGLDDPPPIEPTLIVRLPLDGPSTPDPPPEPAVAEAEWSEHTQIVRSPFESTEHSSAGRGWNALTPVVRLDSPPRSPMRLTWPWAVTGAVLLLLTLVVLLVWWWRAPPTRSTVVPLPIEAPVPHP